MVKYNKDTTNDPTALQHEQELRYKMGLRAKDDDSKERVRKVPESD